MASKNIKIYPASLVIGEMRFKTTMRQHYTPTRVAVIKETDNTVSKDAEQLGFSYTACV